MRASARLRLSPPYERYAGIYDRTGQRRFGAAMACETIQLLDARGEQPASALDLACGTGAATAALAKLGLSVTGLDREPAMLAAARRAPGAEQVAAWIEGDIRDFILPTPVDLVTCFYDSLNYLLTPDDLAACFGAVAAALGPGGWFAFDLNTVTRLAREWAGTTVVAHEDASTLCLFRSTFDPESGRSPLILTVFERDPADPTVWRRWDEEHIERSYPLDLIETLLREAGFEVVDCRAVDDERLALAGRGTEHDGRVFFLARRRTEASDAR